MTNAPLLAIVRPQINRDEGFQRSATMDGKGIVRMGWGRTDGVTLGMFCTREEADDWRDQRLSDICADIDLELPWWRKMNLPRQAVLVEMAYPKGVADLLKIPNTLKAIELGNWASAQTGVLTSKWSDAYPDRAERWARQLFRDEVMA